MPDADSQDSNIITPVGITQMEPLPPEPPPPPPPPRPGPISTGSAVPTGSLSDPGVPRGQNNQTVNVGERKDGAGQLSFMKI